MRKPFRIFVLSIFCSLTTINAQSFYTEFGINALTKMDYESFEAITYDSEQKFSPQKHFELGCKYPISNRVNITLGFSSNAYHFSNRLNLGKNKSLDAEIFTNSLFELDYLGSNLGIELNLSQTADWRFYGSGKMSFNQLIRGKRTDQVINVSDTYFSNLNPNLMQEDYFQKLWCNLQLGFGLSYRVNTFMDIYTQYNFNQTLTSVETEKVNYGFSAHDLSVGLLFNISKQEQSPIDVHLTSDLPDPTLPILSPDLNHFALDLSFKEPTNTIDSSRLKIFFPPSSSAFYENQTESLEGLSSRLLYSPSLRYYILGYFTNFTHKNICIARLKSVLDFLLKKGVQRSQLEVAYINEDLDHQNETVYNRRIELIQMNPINPNE